MLPVYYHQTLRAATGLWGGQPFGRKFTFFLVSKFRQPVFLGGKRVIPERRRS